MKQISKMFLGLLVILVSCPDMLAQTTGDYRSIASGNWSAIATWQRFNGTTWVAATTAPAGTGVITVQSADSVSIDVAASITGTLKNQGKLGVTNNLTIANGGVYEHAQNNGSIPVCTWASGSTCKVTGYVSGSKPSNSNQNFHHFIWSCVGQTANVDLGMSGNTLGGDFTVDTTGASSRVYLTSPGSYTFGNPITINGNVNLRGGQFASNGSGTADTIEVITRGNIVVTGGNFGISRGSGPDVTWRLLGNFSVTNATLQNSGGSTRVNKLIFDGTVPQSISIVNAAYGTGSSPFTMEVRNSAGIEFGNSVLSSSNTGSFLLVAGATMATANPGGVDSTIKCTGASNGGGNTFSPAANFRFNGTTAQVTGMLMPATVDTLTINNAAGVTLSRATTINRRLRLRAGVFNNTVPFTLGLGATISYEGGTILVTSVDEVSMTPRDFFVEQNYPNPFNPTTTIRYGLPSEAFVTARVFNLLGKEVATLIARRQDAGIHSLKFDGRNLGSGIYFLRLEAGSQIDVKRMLLMK